MATFPPPTTSSAPARYLPSGSGNASPSSLAMKSTPALPKPRIRREDDDDDVETVSDEDDAVDVDARREGARERVDGERDVGSRARGARGASATREGRMGASRCGARKSARARRGTRSRYFVYGSSMTRSTGEKNVHHCRARRACARWKAAKAGHSSRRMARLAAAKNRHKWYRLCASSNTCAVISCACKRWCVYARV